MTDVEKIETKAPLRQRVLGWFVTALIYAELIFVALIVLVPIIWIVGASFNPGKSLASASIIPEGATLANYFELIEKTKFISWYKNTLIIAIVNMVFSTFLTTCSAYIFSRFRFKGKKLGLLSILVLQMFPSFLGMTALYTLFNTMGLLDKPLALVLLYAAGQIPYNTWLVKGYLGNIPKALDESAMIDGATKVQIFFKIIFPLARPILSFVALTTFMTPWMDFIFPRLVLSSNENKTLAIGLYDLINNNTNTNFTQFAAGALLVAVPITLIYVFFQKYIISGITAGSVKE